MQGNYSMADLKSMSVPVENSKKLEKTFIYLLTLFNVDYNTLAAYALIKIDYPPPPPRPSSPIKRTIKM